MIRILLVDDDAFFHTTFLSLADWSSLGCTIAYQAENGQQAISILNQHSVDVVITDMVMPGMNGVELIHFIRKEYPQIKCIALSSFDDFDFVRQSLKEGAHDYLLKHAINQSVISELVSTLSPGEQKNAAANERSIWDHLFVEMIQLPEENPHRLEQALLELNVDFPTPPLLAVSLRLQYVTALLKRFEYKDRYKQFLATAVHIVQGALEHYGKTYCACNEYDTIYAVISSDRFSSRLYSNQVAGLLKNNLLSILNRYCNVSAIAAVKSGLDTFANVLPAFQALESELDLQSNADYLQEKDAYTPIVSIRMETEQTLAEWMRSGDFEDIQRTIHSEFESCRIQSSSRNAVRHLAMEFLNLLNRICGDETIPLNYLFPSDSSPYSIVAHLHSFTETVEFITSAYLTLYTLMHDSSISGNIIVQNALRVIRSRYTEDISLTTVAEVIHCNPTYLSRIFKLKTGNGFVTYLNDYRIAQARRLMDSGTLSLRQIAQRVGFPNYNSFSRIFKQRLHQTPQEYMKNRSSSGSLHQQPFV